MPEHTDYTSDSQASPQQHEPQQQEPQQPESQQHYPILAPGVATEEKFTHIRNMFAHDHATAAMGAQITHVSDGHVEGHFVVREDMCNGFGTIQGGVLFEFADSLFAGACNTHGAMTVASHASIHFIAPVPAGARVEGVARVKQSWGRNGITDVTLTHEGKTVAEFRGTSRTVGK